MFGPSFGWRGFLFEFTCVVLLQVGANFGRLFDWHVVQTELLVLFFIGLIVLMANQAVEVRSLGPCLPRGVFDALLANFMNIEKVVLPFEGGAIYRRCSTSNTHRGNIPVAVTTGIRE